MKKNVIADGPESISKLYQNKNVAQTYLEKRFAYSWQALLHRKQVEAINCVVSKYYPKMVLELAPGPARLAVDVKGIRKGMMVENSEEMVRIANSRLMKRHLNDVWNIVQGDIFDLDRIINGYKFDLIYSFRFIRHFHEAERLQIYQIMHKYLEDNGVVIFDIVKQSRSEMEGRSCDVIVYDVKYNVPEFCKEMEENGYQVLSMIPVLKWFKMQSLISHKVDDIAPNIARLFVKCLELLPSNNPLEYIVTCRKNKK
jgi:SAM-dependent methyltransferase